MLVNEIHHALQGEGPYAGQHAVILRLTGCNLRCAECDTPYAFEEGTEMDTLAVLAELKKCGAYDIGYVVVTGGEPLLQAKELNRLIPATPPNVNFGIETNGTLYEILYGTLKHRVSYIVSPKGFGFGDPKGEELYNSKWSEASRYTHAVAFKFVVSSKKDVEKVQRFKEVEKIQDGLIWIMPKCTTREKHFNKWPSIYQWAVEFGFHASPRLHIMAFGPKRGV